MSNIKASHVRGTREAIEDALGVSPDPHQKLNDALKTDRFPHTAQEISDEHARMGDVFALLVDRYNLKIEDVKEAVGIVRSTGREHPEYT